MYTYTKTPERRDRREVMETDKYYKAKAIMDDIEQINTILPKLKGNNTITFSLSKNEALRNGLLEYFSKKKKELESKMKKL